MGIRIISPNGQTNAVLPFVKQEVHSVWFWCNVHGMQHNLIYGKRPVKKSNSSSPGPQLLVEISPSAFQGMAQLGNASLRDFAKKIKKEKVLYLSKTNLVLDAGMQQCVSAITHYQGSEDTKSMYMYARVLDLLWLQQESYLHTLVPQKLFVKTEYDKERIVFARDYLLTHLDAPPTLIQLAAIAGINEFKLKRGFKELFNQTVFGYLSEIRLEMARRALHEDKKTVTQIAFELGYASLQHFSKAFKEKFGVSPARY